MKMEICSVSKCSKRVQPHEEPVLHGNFLDQIVVCSCGWQGVQTEMLSDEEVVAYQSKLKQMQIFEPPNKACSG